jgi:hypothetical protein
MKDCPGDEDMAKELARKEFEITVRNKLVKERRDINLYHHSDMSSHIISSNSSLTRCLRPVEVKDYLHISVSSGPGHVKNYCVLDLPAFLDFRFSLNGEVVLIHTGKRTLIRIPPGPPIWELKMTIPKQLPPINLINGGHITIGDTDEWPDCSFEEV